MWVSPQGGISRLVCRDGGTNSHLCFGAPARVVVKLLPCPASQALLSLWDSPGLLGWQRECLRR